jgi:DNA-directed RNA polymerase specialized sigma24 family protein
VSGTARAEAELTALYDAEVDRLVAFICGSDRTIRFPEAEELACDAVLVARDHWALVRAQGHPAAFVFSVAQRRLIGLRRMRAARGDDLVPRPPAPHASTEDLARTVRLEGALSRLSYRQRQIVLLRELLGFGVTETATILDLTDEKVISEVGDGMALGAGRPGGRRADSASAALRAEEFAALGRALRRGPRRRALARRRFVTALQEATAQQEAGAPGEAGARPEPFAVAAPEERPPLSPVPVEPVVSSLFTPAPFTPAPPSGRPLPGAGLPPVLPRRTAGSGVPQDLPDAPVDTGVAVVLRTSAGYGLERDPAFLRRVLAGLRKL